MVAIQEKSYTVAEYFELEKTAEIRHEFINGQLIPMLGESKIANEITGNCYISLRLQLKKKPYRVFDHEVRLMVKKDTVYRYPDLVVAPKTDDAKTHAVTQPVLIIEVLSDSTASKDRGVKLREYSNLPTLEYYILVDQDQPIVEVYTRQKNGFQYKLYEAITDVVKLDKLEVELSLADVYEDIEWANQASDS